MNAPMRAASLGRRLLLVATLLLPAAAQGEESLTLDAAIARVAATHPDLRLVAAQADVLAAEQSLAELKPALTAGAELENALGSGEAKAFNQAEMTLTLSSTLERGGKLDARRALAQRRFDALAIERETRRLDLLAETARRYLAVVGAMRGLSISEQDVQQRERMVAAAKVRLESGASPEAVLLTAEAAQARSELKRDRARQESAVYRQQLAALWGERDPTFSVVDIDPLVLEEIAPISTLSALLESTPELTYFADETRIREARLQLARSETAPDLDWQLGVRRLESSNDVAMVGSLSIPLGSSQRAQPEIRSAQAELASLSIAREAKGLALYSTLLEAHGRYTLAQIEVRRLQSDVLPRLSQAERAAERAYRAGAISYPEWSQLQTEQTEARHQQLDAALDAQKALIEIQRLTGQSLVIPAPAAAGDTP